MRAPWPLINIHWSKGGTGLTNFDEDEYQAYYAAVRRFGCPHIKIVPYGLQGVNGVRADYALHDVLRRKNLAVFWAIFDQIKLEK